MELWIASSNRGKISEFKSILLNNVPFPLKIHSQKELSVYFPPLETGDSFEANARIKSKALYRIKKDCKDCWVIADDSGLEVEGLHNLPGIYSARYAGDKATDVENTAKLLTMMKIRSAIHRKAQFRCVMVAYSPDGNEHIFEGVLRGEIALTMRGTGGFGYDNIFIPEGWENTLAEMDRIDKNRISHRGVALHQFAKCL